MQFKLVAVIFSMVLAVSGAAIATETGDVYSQELLVRKGSICRSSRSTKLPSRLAVLQTACTTGKHTPPSRTATASATQLPRSAGPEVGTLQRRNSIHLIANINHGVSYGRW